MSISGSTVAGNEAIGLLCAFGAFGQGGAISDEGAITVTGSVFSGNQAAGGPSTLRRRPWLGRCHLHAGALYGVYGPATLTMTGSTMSNNQAVAGAAAAGGFEGGFAEGGGIRDNDSVSIAGSTLSDNQAVGGAGGAGGAEGGGISSSSSTISISASTLTGNLAQAGAARRAPISPCSAAMPPVVASTAMTTN